MNKKALTLLEIIVSIIILSVTMIGMTNLFMSAKRYIMHSRARMGGGELGKLFLDPLQMEVRQDTWDTNANNLRIRHNDQGQSQTINGITYVPIYDVTDAGLGMRRAVVTINWKENVQ